MHRLVLISPVLVLVVAAGAPRRAEACSPPPPVQLAEPVDQPITGVPIAGVVPIFAYTWDTGEEVTVTVTDPDGQQVAGAAELLASRLVWRADQPLAPNTTYRMRIQEDWYGTDEVLRFTTGGADDVAGVPGLEAARALTEIEEVVDSICCDTESINSCTGEPEYSPCWAQAYDYRPQLQLQFDIDDQVRRYWQFRAAGTDATAVASGLDEVAGSWVSASFAAGRDRYCVTVTARSLVTGEEMSARHCAADGELSTIPRSDPEEPDAAACTGDLVDGETGEVIPPDDIDDLVAHRDGGCSTGGGARGGAVLTACMLFFALRLRRRR